MKSSKLYLFLTPAQWLLAFTIGLAAAGSTYPLYASISPWIGVTLFIMGVTLVHFRYSSRFVIPFPHLAISIASLQYVLAAWVSYNYPPSDPMYEMGSNLPIYLNYGAPVLLALVIGWGFGLVGLNRPIRKEIRGSPQLLQILDLLLLIGFLGLLVGRNGKTGNFEFVFALISNLRYVAVFGRMLCKAPGWKRRMVLAFGSEIVLAAGSGMFHSLLLYAMWGFALWIFTFAPSWRRVGLIGVIVLIALPAVQESKMQLRDQTWGESTTTTGSDKTVMWLTYLWDSVNNVGRGNIDEEAISNMAVRYNQGWIVFRVMINVPNFEPYAQGETLKDAAVGALLPRFIFHDKATSGGQVNINRFAGILIAEGTTMNLGYAGEMYANFGFYGGIIACGVYALFFSLLFRMFCIKAFSSPLWWSILPYVGFSSLKAEDSISEVLNWTVKAIIMIIGVCLVSPTFRRALFPPKNLVAADSQDTRIHDANTAHYPHA